jgi:hypothetical protein
MASNQPYLRRTRKLPSQSAGFDDDNPPPQNAVATNARLSTRAPQVQHHLPTSRTYKHLRSRSQSQANFEAATQNSHSHSHSYSQSSSTASRYARKAASTAQLSQQQQPTTIESLISKPPASLTEALQDLRHLILTQGVAADADGNVSSCPARLRLESRLLTHHIVSTTDLHLVDPSRRGTNAHERICDVGPSWSLQQLLQNPQRYIPYTRNRSPIPPPRLRVIDYPVAQCVPMEDEGYRGRRTVRAGHERDCSAVPLCS